MRCANGEGGQVGVDQAAEMAGRQAGDVLEDQAVIDSFEAGVVLSIREEEAHVGTQGGDLFSHEEVERGDLREHCAFRWAVILVVAVEIGPSAGAGGDAQ